MGTPILGRQIVVLRRLSGFLGKPRRCDIVHVDANGFVRTENVIVHNEAST